jgi:hypothetical protein
MLTACGPHGSGNVSAREARGSPAAQHRTRRARGAGGEARRGEAEVAWARLSLVESSERQSDSTQKRSNCRKHNGAQLNSEKTSSWARKALWPRCRRRGLVAELQRVLRQSNMQPAGYVSNYAGTAHTALLQRRWRRTARRYVGSRRRRAS